MEVVTEFVKGQVYFDGSIFEDAYPDEDCGCPTEEWIRSGVSLILHFEPDGSMEVFADTGDWDMNLALKATTMEEARTEAFAWVDSLPSEDDLHVVADSVAGSADTCGLLGGSMAEGERP